jgi:hypothetical protein
MPYGVILRVGAPREAYAALHRQIGELLGDTVPEGAILHIARATDEGFEVIEVWESKEQVDAFNRDVFGPAMARVGADAAGPPPQVIEFEPITTTTFGSYSFEST